MEKDNINKKPGHYLGTIIDEKWWKRYLKDKMFARGNGKYWYDDEAFYFLRYLTKTPITIYFKNIREIKKGKAHAGRWSMGIPVVKLLWIKDGKNLSSGFVLSKQKDEIDSLVTQLKKRIQNYSK